MLKIVILSVLCFTGCSLTTKKVSSSDVTAKNGEPICEKVTPSEDAHFQKYRLDGIDQPASIAEKFDIRLCKEAKDSASGVFHIRKLKGCMTDIKKFSEDSKYEEKVQTEMGQDEFIFLLEGPEVHSLHPRKSEKMKQCEYELPFTLETSGKYHLNLVWVRENFKATDEMNKVWPAAHFDLPLGTKTFLSLGSDGMSLGLAKKQELGTCAPHQSWHEKARWVYQGESDKVFFEEPKDVRCVDIGFMTTMKACKTKNVVRTFIDYEKYDYLPTACRPRRFTKEEAKTCLAGKKVDFRGDSHMRLLFWTLSQWVYGHNSVNREEKQKFQVSRGNINLTHTPLMDKLEKALPPEDLSTYDLVVSNLGHHPADGRHHYTLEMYQKLIDTYASKIPENGKKKLVWFETPAMPLRTDFAVKSFTDWRTDHRFRLYNEYANAKFESMGVPVVKSYDATQSMSLHAYKNKEGYDLWHYPPEVYMPFIHDMLDVIC